MSINQANLYMDSLTGNSIDKLREKLHDWSIYEEGKIFKSHSITLIKSVWIMTIVYSYVDE